MEPLRLLFVGFLNGSCTLEAPAWPQEFAGIAARRAAEVELGSWAPRSPRRKLFTGRSLETLAISWRER